MAIFAKFREQLKHAWNAFVNDPSSQRLRSFGEGASYTSRPDRPRLRVSSERTILASVLTRMGIDAAAVILRHVRVDDNEQYVETIDSGLNYCLTQEANLDQAARMFRQDAVMSMFDWGCIAIVPVDTTINPAQSSGFDVKTMRIGRITGWMPQHVRVSVYDERTGRQTELTLEKRFVAVAENPLYSVMNEYNSTLQRLTRKLALLDAIDEQSSSGKLDIIIQLPYIVKSEGRRQQAEQRRADVEHQLSGSKYGIAYIDGTEKVTQLNRPAENNMLKQVEYLINMLYTQLGLTPEVMNGTADEAAMINYHNRTIEPIVTAIVEAMRRTFLSRTARTQGQTIMAFRDPFKLVPLEKMAEITDKFTRNEVLTANEVRAGLGIKPSKDPKADELKNSNMPEPSPAPSEPNPNQTTGTGGDSQNGSS